ncbi:unnamed protein product [Dibothriocephalus latus]|uniref:Uncharacterized protein n=1 Tax=Dibothriocephalus latus TaxID=60516 RepID=A0A3P7KZR5_DIBLA|nr:unnamed protein product [Dibothriocephalus latus]
MDGTRVPSLDTFTRWFCVGHGDDFRKERHQKILRTEEAQGLRSLKSDQGVIFVRADKGGASLILYKEDYVNKANAIFSDTNAYTLLAEDSTKKSAVAIKKKITQLARQKVMKPDDAMWMNLGNPRTERAYGLPKVHKPDTPLRIKVPLIGSPTYNMVEVVQEFESPTSWIRAQHQQLTGIPS